MKQIKEFLKNQKDVYLMLWVNEMQQDTNLQTTKHYNDMIVCLEVLLEGLDGQEK